MEIGRTSSPSSVKRISNLSAFKRKHTMDKGTNYCNGTDAENRLNQFLPCEISRSGSYDKWLPGRDLRHTRPTKLSRYPTFHGSPGVKRKPQLTRSRSMDTECFTWKSRVTEEAPKSETKTDSGSRSSRKKLFIHVLWLSVTLLLAYCLCLNFLSTGLGCSYLGAPNHTAHFNFHKLKAEFNDRVFGQEMANIAILDILNVYFSTLPVPERPLVLSLHGGMGVGKTLVARILEQHFASSKANVQWYFPGKEALVKWVFRMVRECSANVFILDDIDQGDQGIVMQLSDLLITWPSNALVAQPTQIVFVITTNAGSNGINEIVVREFKQDHQRQDIPLSHFSAPDEFLAIPNLKFVPFLPLDRSVVLLCAKHFMASYKYYGLIYSDSLLDGLLSKEKYFPDDFPVLAKSGCKKIHVGL